MIWLNNWRTKVILRWRHRNHVTSSWPSVPLAHGLRLISRRLWRCVEVRNSSLVRNTSIIAVKENETPIKHIMFHGRTASVNVFKIGTNPRFFGTKIYSPIHSFPIHYSLSQLLWHNSQMIMNIYKTKCANLQTTGQFITDMNLSFIWTNCQSMHMSRYNCLQFGQLPIQNVLLIETDYSVK